MSRVLHVVVRGRVQGVGFRFHTEAVARRLGVPGWVRNLPGGDVEILARLDEEALEAAFLDAVRQGPPGAHVSGMDVSPARDPGDCPLAGFSIRH